MARAARLLLLGAAALVGCSRPEPGAGKPAPSAQAAAPGRDVVLVTIDTLRHDALGFAGNREVETPQLDRLAAEGRVFPNAHASNVVTLPSHANILTGLYPYQHGIRDNTGFRLSPKFATLATLLRETGYATGAFVGAFPLDSRFGLDRGFDVYDDSYPPGRSSDDFQMSERPAGEVLEAAGRWYREAAGKKRFLWVHLYDPHAPYRPPSPHRERYERKPYLGEVAATDAALGPFFEMLREQSSPPLVVFTADHGEALGDHGEATHGLFAYEATLRVPLVLWMPRGLPPGRSEAQARHVDIFPTVLESVGVPIPPGLPGRSLLSAAGPAPAYFEALSSTLNRGWAPLTGVLRGGEKFIDLPVAELYDLAGDPQERRNLFSERRERAADLKRLLPKETAAPAAEPADSEEAKRLLALGYLSGSAKAKSVYGAADDPKNLVGLDNKIHRVVDLFQTDRVREATALAREVVRDRPSMAVGYEFLAFLLQHQGRDAEAAGTLQEAARRGLASEAMQVRLGLILSEAGRTADALGVLSSLAASPDPDTQNAIGIALADGGRFEEALRVFARILEKDPGNAIALQNQGIALLKKGDVPGAIAALDRALAINDELPRALNARGVALANRGDAAGAVASWQRAVELDPRQYDALLNIGIVAGRAGNRALAGEALRRFVATAPAGVYAKDLETARRILREIGSS
jgi:arylsulfatase A-like enzyme/Flp pilus assembly protein TadD